MGPSRRTRPRPEALPLLPEREDAFSVEVALAVDARLDAGPQPLLITARSGLADVEPSPLTVAPRALPSSRVVIGDTTCGRAPELVAQPEWSQCHGSRS